MAGLYASGADDRLGHGTTQQGDPGEWDTPQAMASLQASDAKIAADLHIPVSALTPAIISAYQQEVWNRQGSTVNFIADKVMPAVVFGALTAGAGSGLTSAASAALDTGATASAALGYGAAGALAGAANAYGTGGNIGSSALKGGLTGAAGGALGASNFAGNATNSLAAYGLPTPIAAGLVKGGIGAGVGALGAGLSGGNMGNAALAGGVGGFLSGAISSGTGSNMLGKVASGLGGIAISPFLGGSAPGTATGGQGNNGNINMATINPFTYGSSGSGSGPSTDTSLAGTITGALPGLLQGGAGVYGSQNAAEKLTQADQNAIQTQQSTLGNINSIWNPQRGLGIGADTALGTALGTNGSPADYSGFENMPGYQFAVQQGTQAIQRQAAAMGNAYTPNTAAAVGQYVTGTAMQDYNTYISQLMGAAGLGNQANAGLSDPTYKTGANISTLQQNQGYAQASGVSGAANAVGGIFGPNGAGTSLLGAASRFLGGGSPNNNNNGSGTAPSGGATPPGYGGSPTDPGYGNGGVIDPNQNYFGTGTYPSDPSGGGVLLPGSGAGYDPTSFLTNNPTFFQTPDLNLDASNLDLGAATDFLGG